jgi:hypothetical protein
MSTMHTATHHDMVHGGGFREVTAMVDMQGLL